MNDTINIFSVTDDVFAPYCGVMLTSVFENNRDSIFNVFIFVSKPLEKRNTDRYERLAKKYGHSIQFVIVDDSPIRRHPLSGRWPIATFYKLFACQALPESVTKVLYLDGDIILTGDLSGLWNTDISDVAVAAVPNIRFEDCPRRFNYPVEAGCFSAGVMLINLDFWRKNSIDQQFLDAYDKNYEKIRVGDQDILNVVLWEEKRHLPLTYNFQIQFLVKDIYQLQSPDRQEEILETSKSPLVIHYANAIKPWDLLGYGMPYYKVWQSYKKKSPWSKLLPTVPKHKTVNWLVKRYVLWPLGIKRQDLGLIATW